MATEGHPCDDFSSFVEQSFEKIDARHDSSTLLTLEASTNLLSKGSTAHSVLSATDQHQESQKLQYQAKESSTCSQDSPPSRQNILAWIWREWLLEILACALSLVALVAIVITLTIHDGRPLPQWPFGISVNALVSIFAVILKGSMMLPVSEAVSQQKWSWFQKPRPLVHFTDFDLASRGPWGSLKIIRKTHVLHLTSIGAAITVFALASDPFIQQMIKYRPVPERLDDQQALMQCSNNYTRHGAHTGATSSALDPLTQAAIYKGVYESYSPVKPTCSSGQCTFPEYRTLGMCSQCRDISGNIKKKCESPGTIMGCVWTLDSGLSMSIPSAYRFNMSTVVSEGLEKNDPYLTEMVKTEILSFTNQTTYEAVAVECTLIPCVRTYKANVTQGETYETLLATIPMAKPSNLPANNLIFAGYYSTPMPCLIDGTYYDATAFTERNSTNNIATSGLLPNNRTAYLPSKCVFAFNSAAGVSEYLVDFLVGKVLYLGIASPDWVGQLVYESADPDTSGDSASFRTDFARVNRVWTALAESPTVHMRQNGDTRANGDTSNSEPAIGTAFQIETCIEVQWPWIAYPATLLLVALTFMVVTILESARHTRRQVWKGSPLPLLLHGLDDDTRSEHMHENELGGMESLAKQLRVQMIESDDGMRLVKI